ncbi:hypothetical protein HanRHA438_Chr09g0380961 [Helianthus annuus]|nr:hypothetical protein HanIR_Chr09g0398591 [Helianthus annuus]KAJ0886569.1 hypothetical protein HanRHA438_Chr09g0380961 [Helianthus annuus]
MNDIQNDDLSTLFVVLSSSHHLMLFLVTQRLYQKVHCLYSTSPHSVDVKNQSSCFAFVAPDHDFNLFKQRIKRNFII